MYTKAGLYNIALSALLLRRQITDPATDTSNEAKVLNTFYDIALSAALEDMDLDGTSTFDTLSLAYSNPNDLWTYAYTYPSNCALFRRVFSGYNKDNRATHIPKGIGLHSGDKVIFTNEASAIGQFIPTDIDLSTLSVHAGLAVAYKLAMLSTPLIVGKGALKLKQDVQAMYAIHKAEAQEHDKKENFSYYDERVDSEFVFARTT